MVSILDPRVSDVSTINFQLNKLWKELLLAIHSKAKGSIVNYIRWPNARSRAESKGSKLRVKSNHKKLSKKEVTIKKKLKELKVEKSE